MKRRDVRRHVKANGDAKKAYPDQETALAAAAKQNGSGPKKVRAYECDWCGKWHVGSRKGGGLKAGALPPGKRIAEHHRRSA